MPRSATRNLVLAIGALALEQIFTANSARAQACNANPSPPAAPSVSYQASNETFQNGINVAAFTQGSVGQQGCQGPDLNSNGSPGQAGGVLTSNSQSVRVIGGYSPDTIIPSIGAQISAYGGGGGAGAIGGAGQNDQGGDGGPGGTGGSISVTFNGAFLPDPQLGVASTAFNIDASGGDGNAGGDSSESCCYQKFAGDGGQGGNGGTASVSASGSVDAGNGILVSVEGGGGGDGGDAPYANGTIIINAGQGSNGGNGGSASLNWLSGPVTLLGAQGLQTFADGGSGGDGGDSASAGGSYAGNAGSGGNGGTASVSIEGGSVALTIAPGNPFATVVAATANGGDGGNGGSPGFAIGQGGGSGGNGGAAGRASATILGSVTLTGQTGPGLISGSAVLVQSNGGIGGLGSSSSGIVGGPGGGGFGGAGGSASLTLGSTSAAGSIGTTGDQAHGALVQSVGGAGGNGGNANWASQGGAGGNGGNGGAVNISAPNASVVVQGAGSIAAIAQSIGGGGGTGGDVIDYAFGAQVAIGGNGGLGGNGSAVGLTLGEHSVFGSISTTGGAGILAQSIGGAGGSAGSASVRGPAILTMAIGGDAGGGGAGGPVTVTNGSLISTNGDHATGLMAQSIGGGGGKGGSGFAFSASVVPTAAVAVGGRGGSGGPGGNVSVTNTGQITTYGADSYGVIIQSIGGGGGAGGAAAARAVDLSPSKYVPAISVSIATGGLGGSGNTAGTAGLTNSGLITTAGDGSIAVMAQSIGGGGGVGGDSTAASYSGGNNEGGLSVSVDVAIGGRGGVGGTGNTVTLNNSGVIATLGQDAYGVFAQSVGGGGGAGGGGDASASSNSAKGSVSLALAVGGKGGSGGDGGMVDLTNSGAVTTVGDGSDGIFGQSVGGGGGAGGGGVSTADGGSLSASVGVGGSGGAGGNGNTVTAANSGSIVTRGTDSVGLLVQSIGGGGGKAGKGGATAGGTSSATNAQNLFDVLSGGLNGSQSVTNVVDNILQIGQAGENIAASLEELQGFFQQPQAGDDEIGSSPSVNVSVSVGGSGGAGGKGGNVSATNTGAIVTYGAQSDGIYAQSVGGGGGSAGAATSTSASSDDNAYQTAISVGGGGGFGNDGGSVTVVNGPGGTILTQGVTAVGIYAQSVGGGGGEGASAGAVSGSFKSISAIIGGDGGGGGNGGAVSVTTGDAAGTSTITTTGKHGIGILAQSVGGGGGVARTMTTNMTFDPSKIINNPQGRLGDLHGLDLTFGGKNGSGGSGGAVSVTASGAITTSGLDAHAVLAQSIGGGGGLALGGQALDKRNGPLGNLGGSGNGGQVSLMLNAGTTISTSGDGAYGVIAQSIGGGGGLLGDLSQTPNDGCGCLMADMVAANQGNGGSVSVTATGAQIQTTGARATAIFAQSVGGGGGLGMINRTDGTVDLNIGTVGGSGSGGPVSVSLVNSHVLASGATSNGILVQSVGSSVNAATVSIDGRSSVMASTAEFETAINTGSAIRILNGSSNRIINAGTIAASNPAGGNGIAISTNTPSGSTSLSNTGVIRGDLDFNDPLGSRVDNSVGGAIDANYLRLGGQGVLTNAGTLHVGGVGRIGRTELTGDLIQEGTGRLRIDANALAGKSDLFTVTGTATLSGTIQVDSVGLRKGLTDPVLMADGGIRGTVAVSGLALPIFTQSAVIEGRSLALETDADFGAGNRGRTPAQRSLAAHLQRIWDGGVSGFEQGFAGLARLTDLNAYAPALDAISGQEVAAVASARYEASQNFARDAFACSVLSDDPALRTAPSCVWGRAAGALIDHGGNGGFPAYRFASTSLKVGGQIAIAPDLFLSGALGYEAGRLNESDSRVRGLTDTGMGLVGLRYQAGPWTFDGVADFAYGEVDLRRSLFGLNAGTAASRTDAFNAGMHLRAGYTLPIGAGFYAEPAMELDANVVRIGGYTERGAGPFNLRVASLNDTVFAATPGFRLGSRLTLGPDMVAHLYAGAGLSLLAGNTYEVDARFAALSGDAGSFRSRFVNDDMVGRFVAGVELRSLAGIDLRLQYTGRQSSHQSEHGGQLRMEYRF